MGTKVVFKIASKPGSKVTYVQEYWDDLFVFRWRVGATYRGGNVEEFMQQHDAWRIPIFEGLDEFYRRTFLLDV